MPGSTYLGCDPGPAWFDVMGDGSAVLTATLVLDSGPGVVGQVWDAELHYAFRGQGPAGEGGGGPKLELQPGTQPAATTDQWDYYDLLSGTLSAVESSEYVTLVTFPVDGQFPMQLGFTANGKNGGYGASEWFAFTHHLGEQEFTGLADMTADLALVDPPACDSWTCESDDLCAIAVCGGAVGECSFAAEDCADDDVCTADSCDPLTGLCQNEPVAEESCDDGDACTSDTWNPTTCSCESVPIPQDDCDDGDPCTDESWNPDTCQCDGPTAKECPQDDDPCTLHLCQPSSGDCNPLDICHEVVFCPDDAKPAHACGDVPLQGSCQGDQLQRCAPQSGVGLPQYAFELEDCAAAGQACGWDAALQAFDCLAPGNHECDEVPLSNVCSGATLWACAATGLPVSVDCAQYQRECAWNGDRYACVTPGSCVPQCHPNSCGDDGCGGLCSAGGCGLGLTCTDGGICSDCAGPFVPEPGALPQVHLFGGPQCSAGSRGESGPALGLVLLLLAGLWWRRRARFAAGAVAAVLLLAPPPAGAQDGRGFNLQHFMPVPHADRIINVEGTEVAPAWRPSVAVWFHYMKEPLRLHVQSPGQPDLDLERVTGFFGGDLGLGFGLGGFMDIQAVLPFKLGASGDSSIYGGVEDGALGDLWLRARLRALEREPGGGFGLAFQAGVSVPLGDPSTMAASQATGFQIGTSATWERGRFLGAANARFQFQNGNLESINLLIGDEFRYGAGASVRAVDWMRVGAELYGSVSLETANVGNAPLELVFGPRFLPGAGLQIDLGFGVGLTDGYGAPDYRVAAGLTWAMAPEAEPAPAPVPVVEPIVPPRPPSVCGNGILEEGEECDDGNRLVGDGCGTFCRKRPVQIDLDPVFFATNVRRIESDSESTLERNLKKLRDHPRAKILLRGSADVRAGLRWNCGLAEDRVKGVRDALLDRHVSPDRIAVEWVGDQEPNPVGRSDAVLHQNRRVDFILLPPGAQARPSSGFACKNIRGERNPKKQDR